MKPLILSILILFLSSFAFAEDNLIPQEIEWKGDTYIYNPHWKEYESLKDGDFDGDGKNEIIVSFAGQMRDRSLPRPFYLIYDVINGKRKLVKTIIGNWYLGEVRIIDLEKDGQQEIAIFSHGGAHYTNLYIYKYKNDVYECIFEDGSACLIETDFEADKPVIKVGRAKWGTKIITEDGEEIDWSYASGGHGDSYWQVYVWNGKEFIYDEKSSTVSEISENEELLRYLDKAKSLMENKKQELHDKETNDFIDEALNVDFYFNGRETTYKEWRPLISKLKEYKIGGNNIGLFDSLLFFEAYTKELEKEYSTNINIDDMPLSIINEYFAKRAEKDGYDILMTTLIRDFYVERALLPKDKKQK